MQKVFLFGGICAMGTFIPSLVTKTPSTVNPVVVENVMALSNTDDSEAEGPTTCYLSGDLNCPNGVKVGVVYKGYSLR